ncbi:MAG: zf-HC2 domain-containing protein [Pirellulales bacterium]|nr:zf-HC2 domain-containing protein [Pirellulales bacterium]
MNCEELQPLINAWIDGELPTEQEPEVREHLTVCSHCAAVAEETRALDAELTNLIGSQTAQLQTAMLPIGRAESSAVTQASLEAFSEEADTKLRTPRSSSVTRSSVVSWVCAAAATVLILVFSWKGVDDNGPGDKANLVTVKPAARLVVAKGEVQMSTPAQQRLISCAPQTELPPGWKLITGENSRCELTTASPDQPIRLDQNSELTHVFNNTMRLEKGKLWSAAKDRVCIESASANIAAENAVFEFCCAADNSGSILNVYQGEVEITNATGDATQVKAGQSVRLTGGAMESTPAGDPVLQTSWVNDILVEKGREDQELADRIEWLWNQVAAKGPAQAEMYESEIRALGSSSVIPLCNWVQSPASLSAPSKRVRAAKLLSDLAGPGSIPQLIELLSDHDGDIRYAAATALQRLTGKTHGCTPEEWRALPSPVRQKARGDWDNWRINNHKDGAL